MQIIPTKQFDSDIEFDIRKKKFFKIIDDALIGEKIYLLSIYSKKDDGRILNDRQIELLIKNLIEDVNDS